MRGCQKSGDLIAWFTVIEGLNFREACAELHIQLESGNNFTRRYRPLREPCQTNQASFEPRAYALPSEKWQKAASRLACEANSRISDYPFILSYLASRGLPKAAIAAYGLGYIEGEGKQADGIFRPRAAYDLPEKYGKDGKLLRAFRIPRGITIPAFGKNKSVLRVRIRRRDIDRDKNNPKDPKYLLVPQPDQPYSAPLALYPENLSPELATWVIVEAELDAMAIHHACHGQIGVISVLTAKGKPDRQTHETLLRAARILVALDADEDKEDGSNPGAEAWLWWKQTYPQAKLWPVPVGKDPGEAFAQGIDLAEWIFAGTPLRKTVSSGLSAPACENSQTVNKGTVGVSLNTAAMGKGLELEAWPVPASARSFTELELPGEVQHRDLLRAFGKHPLDHPDCLLPCPKTEPPFWWRYYRDCARFKCKGDPLCLLGILKSRIFLEALKNGY